MSRVLWSRGLAIPHDAGTIYAASENGRRFWCITTRDRGGWPFTHEFSTAEEAMAFSARRYRGES